MESKKGSSLVLVIALVLLFATMGTGLFYMSKFTTRESRDSTVRLYQLYLAKNLHRSVTAAAEAGELEILNMMLAEAGDLTGEYTATTGAAELEFDDGKVVTVQMDLTLELGGEEVQAVLDTIVRYPDGGAWQFSALLSYYQGADDEEAVDEEASADEASGDIVSATAAKNRWVVRRQYQTEMEVR